MRSRREAGGRWLRRFVMIAVVATQLFLLVRGYSSPQPTFAFQMFREASTWQADIHRVTRDGERLDVREWPEYEWPALVQGRGLGDPFAPHHAASGIESTFDFLQEALDWVALNTPADLDTRYLEAEVTYWENGRGPFFRAFRSVDRGAVP